MSSSSSPSCASSSGVLMSSIDMPSTWDPGADDWAMKNPSSSGGTQAAAGAGALAAFAGGSTGSSSFLAFS